MGVKIVQAVPRMFGVEHKVGPLHLHWVPRGQVGPACLNARRAGVPTLPDDRAVNQIIATLAVDDRLPWGSNLELVDLPARAELQSPGIEASHVHFPISALVVWLHPTSGGDEVPVALVGHDGVVGMSAFLGVPPEAGRAVVLHPGAAWRLAVKALTAEGLPSARVIQAVLGHLQDLTTQIAQTALCEKTHSVEQRLCRWLLNAFDRVPGDALALDLGDLTDMLDVPVDALACAAAQLVGSGTLACEPGRLVLLDRSGLQTRTCGCQVIVSSRGM